MVCIDNFDFSMIQNFIIHFVNIIKLDGSLCEECFFNFEKILKSTSGRLHGLIFSLYIWGMIKTIPEKELSAIKDSYNCVVIQTAFEADELNDSRILAADDVRIEKTIDLVENAANRLENGGLLYIYGLPKHLSFYAVFLNKLEQGGHRFLFKYWISIECKPTQLQQPLPNSHIGMLMYLKTSSLKNPTPFKLKTKKVRIPYSNCHSCEKNVKDWGGKRHLMNPIGSAISDVWSDFQVDINDVNEIPQEAVNRIYDLLPAEKIAC